MTFADALPYISLLIALGGLYLNSRSFKKNDIKDIEEKAKESATLNVKLDAISLTVTDIKYDISATKKEVSALSERVTSVEQSTKSAHHRIDAIEGN